MNYSCIICLCDDSSKFYNVCDKCKNFILCKSCYNTTKTHKIIYCVHCRQELVKDDKIIKNCFFMSFLYFLRFFFVYVSLIIIPSNIIASYFPNNFDSSIFTSNKDLFIVINNFNYLVIVPYILYIHVTQCYLVFLIYCVINIFFIIFLFTSTYTIHDFFRMYIIVSIYTFIYLHICIIMMLEILSFYTTKVNKFIHTQKIYALKIYNTLYNNNNNITPFKVYSF